MGRCHALLLWLWLWPASSAQGPPSVPAMPPPLSVRDPTVEGFDGFTREGPQSPLWDRLCFGDKRKAFPTSKWWLPLVRPRPRAGRSLLVQLPYIVQVLDTGLEVYYPHVKASAHAVQNVIGETPSWHITCKRTQPYCIKDADEFIVRIVWGDVLDVTLVRGSPYINIFSQAVALKINSLMPISHLVVGNLPYFCGVQSDPARVFKVELRSEEEWTVFTDSDIRLQCDPITNGLTTSEHFFGLIRLALSNNCTSYGKPKPRDDNPHCGPWSAHPGNYAKALLEGSQTCTRGGNQVSTELVPDGVQATIHWNLYSCWAPLRLQAETPVGKLMMTALPHQLPLLGDSVAVVAGGGHRNLRGWAAGVLATGGYWVLTVRHPDIGWLEPPDRFSMNATRKALKGTSPTDKSSDMHYDLPRSAAEGSVECYPAGRMLLRLATLVQVAEVLGEAKAAQGLLARLTERLSLWLDHGAKNRLVYDQSWGGVVACGHTYNWYQSAADCPTLEEPGTESGSALFNDHHFHYGYFIHAAAVVAKFNRKWASVYKEKVTVLIRDISNPSQQDPHFPPYRHFDWYVGHSWASGITLEPHGQKQESSSEAIHAWYSIYLYGLAVEDERLQALGKAMFFMEAHSTNFYWRISNGTAIYPKPYEHRLIGTLQEMQAEHQASSGTREFALYGAQLLPIAPHILLTTPLPWAIDAYHEFRRSCAADEECEDSGTVAALAAHQALLDRAAAWEFADDLPADVFSDTCAVGAGTSRTALLHFIGAYGAGEKVVDLAEETAVPVGGGAGRKWLALIFVVALVFGGFVGYEAYRKAKEHLEEQRSLLPAAQELMPHPQHPAHRDSPAPVYGTDADPPPELDHAGLCRLGMKF